MPEPAVPGRRANDVADWLEVAALVEAAALGGDALHAKGAAVGLGPADVGLAVQTMARRAALLGPSYPFRVGGGGIAAMPGAAATPYSSLLLVSPAVRGSTGVRLEDAAVYLEEITAAALEDFFGAGTDVVRFAWPSTENRPPEFPDAVRWLAGRMGTVIGAAYRPPYRKDGGVDVVAWRPFADRRSGFPVLLAQCTLEQGYEHKTGDIDLRVWAGWLRLDIDPITALAIPGVVPDGEQWNQLAARTVVLDRLRVVGLLGERRPGRVSPALRWSAAAVDRLQAET